MSRSCLHPGVGENLVGLDGSGWRHSDTDGHAEQQEHCNGAPEYASGRQTENIWLTSEEPGHVSYSAGATIGLRDFRGAPTLRRRSDSENAPPMNISTAPIQMKRTSGLK
jgi:hypothetical protein